MGEKNLSFTLIEQRMAPSLGFLGRFRPPVRTPQPPTKALQPVKPPDKISKPSNEAITEIAKKPLVPKKVAIGAGVLGSVAVLSSGALGDGCEMLMGANNCQFITAPEAAMGRLTGLPAQLAEVAVYLACGAFVAGTTYLAWQVVDAPRIGWTTLGTATVSTFIAFGVANSED